MLKALTYSILLTLVGSGSAHAGSIGLDIGNANLYSLGDFNASSSDVEGGVVVAGNLAAKNYSINNLNKDAYSSYAAIVGGNLNYNSGALKNGAVYVGGTSTTTSTGFDDAALSPILPLKFAEVSSKIQGLSTTLSGITANGTASIKYSGMTLTGSGSNVTVFDITGADLAAASYFNFNNLDSAQTMILNVSGVDAIGFNQNGAGLSGFKDYNVLFNFYEASNLNLQSLGLYGSLLAPLATVTGGNGHIDGNVVVGNWNSNVQVNAVNYFKSVDFPSYPSDVPEPGVYALILIGLGSMCLLFRGKRSPLSPNLVL